MWAATQHKSALLLDDTVIITQPHAYTEESLITMTRIRKINSSMQLWLTQSISRHRAGVSSSFLGSNPPAVVSCTHRKKKKSLTKLSDWKENNGT